MSKLVTRIGSYDSATQTVPVRFTSGAIVHQRSINAVLSDDGAYDRAATKQRVDEVGRGVLAKIEAGVIAAPATEATDA